MAYNQWYAGITIDINGQITAAATCNAGIKQTNFYIGTATQMLDTKNIVTRRQGLEPQIALLPRQIRASKHIVKQARSCADV